MVHFLIQKSLRKNSEINNKKIKIKIYLSQIFFIIILNFFHLLNLIYFLSKSRYYQVFLTVFITVNLLLNYTLFLTNLQGFFTLKM